MKSENMTMLSKNKLPIFFQGDSIWKRPKPAAVISRPILTPQGLFGSYKSNNVFPWRILQKMTCSAGAKVWNYIKLYVDHYIK